MGFDLIYRVLQEVFPQVDSRMLRAVAIEHSFDAEAAVEVVLVEVIPNLSKQSVAVCSSNELRASLTPSEVAVTGDTTGQPKRTTCIELLDVIPHRSKQSTEASPYNRNGIPPNPSEDAGTSNKPGSTTTVDTAPLEGSLNTSSFHDARGETDGVCGHDVDGEPVLLEKFLDNRITNSASALSTSVCENNSNDNHEGCGKTGGEEVSSLDTSEKDSSAIEMVNPEDEATMNSVITRSNQICSTKVLANMIVDAKNNKKILVSAMDLIISLMREVECKEKAAQAAKEQAARGCLDILDKVDELKQALRRAKEANDMHAGEVYAEKAILATEMKELQLRVLSLSDERDRSLGILDEMHKALEVRLDAALKEIEAAEHEKLEKEGSAREALAFQESQMEKVVEESRKLKLEAEENSKLQEFVTDRGRVVDMLQGEISVKCQDIKLLKEKFDKRIPLSQSLSSSQTSSISTSPSSSSRSITTPREPLPDMVDPHNTLKKSAELADSYGFLEKSSGFGLAQSPKTVMIDNRSSFDDPFPSAEEKHSDDRKVLLDDSWELFENGDLSWDA